MMATAITLQALQCLSDSIPSFRAWKCVVVDVRVRVLVALFQHHDVDTTRDADLVDRY